MTRYAPRLMVLLLCGSALAGCASAPQDIASATGGKTAGSAVKAQLNDLANSPGDLDSSVRQAQLARVAGQYDQAVHILSQLMLVAADDPRVMSEYGKTLAQQGRATEAVQFLGRASELSPNDWTVYSALGVAYDQMGNQPMARTAYERALALKPGEASVLNNYALSRMLANDPDGARILIGRAEIAGGAADPKIARNIALVNQLAPSPEMLAAAAVHKPATEQMAASRLPVTQAPQVQLPIVIPAPPAIASTGAPRPLLAQQSAPVPAPQAPQPRQVAQAPQPAPRAQVAQQNLPAMPVLAMPAPSSLYAPYQAVVMQRVPVDPLAGPVKPAIHLVPPHAVTKAMQAPDATGPDAKGVAIAKPVLPKTADAKPVPAAQNKAAPAPNKTADARNETKPDAKPVKGKNVVPALRMTVDARQP